MVRLPRSTKDVARRMMFRWLPNTLPTPVLGRFYQRATDGMSFGVCLHRVCEQRRPHDALPAITLEATTLDAFVDLVWRYHRGLGETTTVTLGFDDGYRDAVDYVQSRAPKYKNIEWIVFVCPEKLEKRVGYRWDAYEVTRCPTYDIAAMKAFVFAPGDVDAENAQPLLREVASRPEFALATVEDCRVLQTLPNVRLGNHTNTHLNLNALPLEAARKELTASVAHFEKLFGPCRHFAFAFGVPHVHWSYDHVAHLRRLGRFEMWSTQEELYYAQERRAGRVMPRLVFHGQWSAKQMLFWVAYNALRMRQRRSRRQITMPWVPAGLVGNKGQKA